MNRSHISGAEHGSKLKASRLLSAFKMQENERLRARLAEMQSHPSPLEAATAKRDEHVQDQEKFRKLIDSLQVSSLQLDES